VGGRGRREGVREGLKRAKGLEGGREEGVGAGRSQISKDSPTGDGVLGFHRRLPIFVFTSSKRPVALVRVVTCVLRI
jgi:hypothetical protein